MTNLEPQSCLDLCFQRMKIELCFRDLKSLLHIDKVMFKSQVNLNKMLAMVMLAYAISLIVGEAIRDVQYTLVSPDHLNLLTVPIVDKSSRWYLFSGPFLLLKQRFRLPKRTLRIIVSATLLIFSHLIFSNVQSFLNLR
jgi:hypothetical protein